MAMVTIRVYSGSGDYEVEQEYPEMNHEAWGADKSHLDGMVDRAVAAVKRAYWPPEVGSD